MDRGDGGAVSGGSFDAAFDCGSAEFFKWLNIFFSTNEANFLRFLYICAV
jgi:hypothetical protein